MNEKINLTDPDAAEKAARIYMLHVGGDGIGLPPHSLRLRAMRAVLDAIEIEQPRLPTRSEVVLFFCAKGQVVNPTSLLELSPRRLAELVVELGGATEDPDPEAEGSACAFCAIVAGEAPAKTVREWDDAIAIVPLKPVVRGHLLVLPKRHVQTFFSDPDTSAATMRRVAEMVHGVERHHDPNDYNVITSAGRAATQTVFHFHVHLVPRRPGDGLHLPWTDHAKDPEPEVDPAQVEPTIVEVCQRIRAGWLPHCLSGGPSWWWGRPEAADGFRLWSKGLVPSMGVVERMTQAEVAAWTATLNPHAAELASGRVQVTPQ